jgi:hypothetical protein
MAANMTNWRSVAAAMEDTTAVLDPCNLKHRRKAYFTVYSRRQIRQGRKEGAHDKSTYVREYRVHALIRNASSCKVGQGSNIIDHQNVRAEQWRVFRKITMGEGGNEGMMG